MIDNVLCVCFQEIGFFDDPKHSTGALTARLASDASGVKGVSVEKIKAIGGKRNSKKAF